MTALLTRFKLSPPGIKRLNGTWSLLKVNPSSNYGDFLSQHAREILNSENNRHSNSNRKWSDVLSTDVAKYLYSRHPKLQFLNFSEQCDLTITTHIQAIGTKEFPSHESTHFKIT